MLDATFPSCHYEMLLNRKKSGPSSTSISTFSKAPTNMTTVNRKYHPYRHTHRGDCLTVAPDTGLARASFILGRHAFVLVLDVITGRLLKGRRGGSAKVRRRIRRRQRIFGSQYGSSEGKRHNGAGSELHGDRRDGSIGYRLDSKAVVGCWMYTFFYF